MAGRCWKDRWSPQRGFALYAELCGCGALVLVSACGPQVPKATPLSPQSPHLVSHSCTFQALPPFTPVTPATAKAESIPQ